MSVIIPPSPVCLFDEGNPYVVWEDLFLDAQAAGGVDGTTVPGAFVNGVAVVRDVTDTESKLSISGGNLVISGGKVAPAIGDPGAWWKLATPAAIPFGALHGVLIDATPADTVTHTTLGLDADTAGHPHPRFNFAAGPLRITDKDSNQLIEIADGYSASRAEWLILQRNATNGYLCFVDGKLICVGTGDVHSSAYVAVSNYNAALNVHRVAHIDLSSVATADFAEQTDIDATPAATDEIDRAAGSALLEFGAVTLPGTDPLSIYIRYVDSENFTSLSILADGSATIKETIATVEGAALGSCAATGITDAVDLTVLDDDGEVRVMSNYVDAFTATLTDHEEAVLARFNSLGA